MKNLILLLAFVLFQNCNFQNKDKEAEVPKDKTLIVTTKSNTNDITKKELDSEKNTIKYNSLSLRYEENLNIPKETLNKLPAATKAMFNELLKKPIYFELKSNGAESIFQVISNIKKEYTTKNAENTGEDKQIVILPSINVYKNFNTHSIVQQRVLDKTYLVSESLTKIAWKITNEKQKINKFICTKAISKIDNSNVIAWFTDEIPSNDGPSIYHGLPGLILKIETRDYNFLIVDIKFDSNINIKKFTDGTVISQNNFDKKVKQQHEHPTTTMENVSE